MSRLALSRRFAWGLAGAPVLAAFLATAAVLAAPQASGPVPASAASAAAGQQIAVLAGGCFWGMESVFEHVKGVRQVQSGYAGGAASTAHYDQVSDGDTGHAESVRIVYDPAQVSYADLLKIYFAVAHDPTEKDRQGPDVGTQYRSEIFYLNAQQKQIASQTIAQLNASKVFSKPIVTEVAPLPAFYPAEAYHQDYAERHPNNLYIVINDAPKVAQLKSMYPQFYRASEALASTEQP
ncbi:MAG: peptide-methionine (S)-S-oxide reductase MsrA [Dyella sp.]